MQYALVIGKVMAVVFLVFHDWVPLGKLNNVAGLRAVDTTNRLAFTTAVSTMPFAAVLVVSILFASVEYPNWLLWWSWGTRAGRCDIGCSCVSHLHAPMNIMPQKSIRFRLVSAPRTAAARLALAGGFLRRR
jgi:hypothetical protein